MGSKVQGCPCTARRFRPNIVVSGAPAWAEDGWEELGKGSLGLRAVKPCDRCRVPRTDQATAEVGHVHSCCACGACRRLLACCLYG